MAVNDAIEAEGRIVEVLARDFSGRIGQWPSAGRPCSGRRRLVFERMSVGDSVKCECRLTIVKGKHHGE